MPLEKSLIEHCSPTLASLKIANLFSYKYQTEQELEASVDYWNKEMTQKGIRLFCLRRKDQKALIYVCRYAELCNTLKNEQTAEFLQKCGYHSTNADEVLEELKKRLSLGEGFPHEIGVFLGYPLEDVVGFIKNTGKNFQYSGVWKVYGDPQKAEKMFCKYKKCTDIYIRLWNSGRSVWQLTVAA